MATLRARKKVNMGHCGSLFVSRPFGVLMNVCVCRVRQYWSHLNPYSSISVPGQAEEDQRKAEEARMEAERAAAEAARQARETELRIQAEVRGRIGCALSKNSLVCLVCSRRICFDSSPFRSSPFRYFTFSFFYINAGK